MAHNQRINVPTVLTHPPLSVVQANAPLAFDAATQALSLPNSPVFTISGNTLSGTLGNGTAFTYTPTTPPGAVLQSGVYNAITTSIVLTISNGNVINIPLAALIPIAVANSTSVTLVGNGTAGAPVTAQAVISPAAGNTLAATPTGLFVPTAPVSVAVANSTSVILAGNGTAGAPVTAQAVISPAAGNTLAATPTGLFVPTVLTHPPLSVVQANAPLTFNAAAQALSLPNAPVFTISGNTLSGTLGNGTAFTYTPVIPPGVFLQSGAYNPATTSLVLTNSNGSTISVPLAALIPIAVANSTSVALVGNGTAGAPVTAQAVISPAAGNTLAATPTGLFVPTTAVNDFWRGGAGANTLPDGVSDFFEFISRAGSVGIGVPPLSSFDTNGSFGAGFTTTTANTYIANGDYTVDLAAPAQQTLVLPPPASVPRRVVVVRNATGFQKVMTPYRTIGGNISSALLTPYTTITLASDGTDWVATNTVSELGVGQTLGLALSFGTGVANTPVAFLDVAFRYSLSNAGNGNLDMRSASASPVQIRVFGEETYVGLGATRAAIIAFPTAAAGTLALNANTGAWTPLAVGGLGVNEYLSYIVFTATTSYRATLMNFQSVTMHLSVTRLT